MIKIRRSEDRGHQNHGWLDSFHTFSFADYHDPDHMGFRSLRVINEDWVQPSKGFGTHQHHNMEILTYVLAGKLAHKDSIGNGSEIVPGEIQKMSAGSGISHSEFNASDKDPVHLLQIWILPNQKDLKPAYEQKTIAVKKQPDTWHLLASPTGEEGSVRLFQDARVWAMYLEAGHETRLPLSKERFGWLQIADGEVDFAGFEMKAGDGASIEEAGVLDIHAKTAAEFLFFDLS